MSLFGWPVEPVVSTGRVAFNFVNAIRKRGLTREHLFREADPSR